MLQHRVDDPDQVVDDSKDRLDIGLALGAFSFIESSERRIEPSDSHCHQVEDPPQAPIAALGDSASALMLARLVHRRIDTGEGDELAWRGERSAMSFGEEVSSGNVTEAGDRVKQGHVLGGLDLAALNELVRDSRFFFLQIVEEADLGLPDPLGGGGRDADGGLGRPEEKSGIKGEPPAAQLGGKPSGRNLLKERPRAVATR